MHPVSYTCILFLASCILFLYPVSCILYPVSCIHYPIPVFCFLHPVSYTCIQFLASCILYLYPVSCILYPIPVSCFNYLHGESSVVRAGTERLYFSRKFSRTWNNIKIIKKLIFNNKQTNFVINNSFFLWKYFHRFTITITVSVIFSRGSDNKLFQEVSFSNVTEHSTSN